jgi:hypothetical protein
MVTAESGVSDNKRHVSVASLLGFLSHSDAGLLDFRVLLPEKKSATNRRATLLKQKSRLSAKGRQLLRLSKQSTSRMMDCFLRLSPKLRRPKEKAVHDCSPQSMYLVTMIMMMTLRRQLSLLRASSGRTKKKLRNLSKKALSLL